MEGGVTVILTLMIVFGMIVGGVALFGAGGYVERRRRQKAGEQDAGRPTHTVVENETRDVEFPRDPSTSPRPNE
ncbi:MAG: hypothetical protein KY433_07590 [Actinobacteria bacterium]|nr:hypothetical protein [Actinomycetota bacterium]